MYKKLLLIFSILLFIVTCIPAQVKNDTVKTNVIKDTIPAFFGFSYIPMLNWKVFSMTNVNGGYLRYKFTQNSQSSFEGNFAISRVGLRVGLSANLENNFIGKAYQYAGYINLKNYWLRLQSTRVSGVINWIGALPPGYFSSRNFSTKYLNIEILKTSSAYKYMSGGAEVNKILGTYWGIGFTSMGLPLKMNTLVTPGGREKQKFGVPAYDTLFTAKLYSACFGLDLLRQLCMTGGRLSSTSGKPAKHFGVYAATQDKIGFGTGIISDYGKSMAETMNPGYTFVNSRGFVGMVHYSLSLGFRYYRIIGPVFLLSALGYDLEGAAIINSGGAADTNKDLGYDANFFYLNHGVSLKLYISWIGNK